ncbi:MAG: hypothetical protein ACLFP8_00185 [Alphaproteobacteria bacterium]
MERDNLDEFLFDMRLRLRHLQDHALEEMYVVLDLLGVRFERTWNQASVIHLRLQRYDESQVEQISRDRCELEKRVLRSEQMASTLISGFGLPDEPGQDVPEP